MQLPKSDNQKLKILYILDYLQKNSHQDHPVRASELAKMLEGHGILCDRKTIYSDIAALQDFGIDILIYRGKNGGYYIGQRQFQLPELKLLIGAVQSSRFLTEEKSLELIDKLCRLCSQEEAEQVIQQAEAFQKKMLAAYGTRFVFPSDEFYQIAKHPLPDVDSYEDFPQFENGVGLLCRLKDEYETAVRLDPDEGQAEKRRVIMACGTSVAPFLRELITSHPVSGVDIRIKPIVNYFFGETVTVSGLITGQDLVAQLKGEEADEILITESMLRQGEEIFLDDMTLEQAQQQLGIRITPVPDDGADLLYALRGTEE